MTETALLDSARDMAIFVKTIKTEVDMPNVHYDSGFADVGGGFDRHRRGLTTHSEKRTLQLFKQTRPRYSVPISEV